MASRITGPEDIVHTTYHFCPIESCQGVTRFLIYLNRSLQLETRPQSALLHWMNSAVQPCNNMQVPLACTRFNRSVGSPWWSCPTTMGTCHQSTSCPQQVPDGADNGIKEAWSKSMPFQFSSDIYFWKILSHLKVCPVVCPTSWLNYRHRMISIRKNIKGHHPQLWKPITSLTWFHPHQLHTCESIDLVQGNMCEDEV